MGIYTGTIATFLSGELPDSDKFDEVTDCLTALTAAWTSFTPTVTGSAGSPTLGNGTITGRYRQIGKTVDLAIGLNRGSTTDFGTGYLQFGNLPVAANNTSLHAITSVFYDSSAGAGFAGSGFFDTGTVVRPVYGSGNVTNTAPFTWASPDQLFISITYEVA